MIENNIKEITTKLKNGTYSKDQADKLLINIFKIIKGNSISKILTFLLGIACGSMITYILYIFNLL
jgi:hypothetical protein